MTHALEPVLRLPFVAETGRSVGDAIKERREGLGLDRKDLATRAGIDRGQLAAIEENEVRSPRRSTIKAITDALDEADGQDAEMSGPYDAEAGQVTFRLRGSFGVDVTVQGPVANLPELRETVAGLIEKMGETRPE